MSNPLAYLVARLRLWTRRASERDELASLDDRQLRDAGLNRYEVEHEARKPFWRE